MEHAVIITTIYIFTFVCGLCLGSFATALIHRIPRNISWITHSSKNGKGAAYSACTSCGSRLRATDLIPVFSWLFFKGKCRHCGKGISCFYPVIEIVTTLAIMALFWAWGATWPVLPLILSAPFLITAIVIDWEHMILPDEINIVLFVLSLIFLALLWQEGGKEYAILENHIGSGILLFVSLFSVSFLLSKWKGRAALGWGDLKFLPAAGIFLGLAALPSYLALSGLLGLATAALKGSGRKGGAFPFGPALIISLYIHVFLTGLGFDYTW